ncbi:sodium:dicarboxylate symporter [Burkholderia ubonensis]|uniref:dicarboxylate/amino acid:cation symporter n=1 Tax=Burkholderia ubonensis TaxID=101571 RepID=UPI000753CFE0|nr:dicarboxylate/amino acid:cation symporter [Burkholderia ubonensis]KVO11056.1 sodium:dicarboxylate symporter [Burkholderia ubonensis]
MSEGTPILKRLRFVMWQKIFLAMVLGAAAGHFLGEPAKSLQPLGDVFISLIRMCVIPVVFVSVVCGITSMSDLAAMRRIAWKSIAIYTALMGLAVVLAMGAAALVGVGKGLNLPADLNATHLGGTMSLKEALMAAVPSNPFKAFSDGALLPTIVFAIFLGLAINLSGERATPVRTLFDSLSVVVFKLIGMVLKFAPLGVFGLMAYVTADHGFTALGELGSLVAVNYVVMIAVMVIVSSMCLAACGLHPWPFLRKMVSVQLFAYSSASSAATLPLNLETCQTRLGVDSRIAGFVLPLGSTVNMAGLACYLGTVAIFASNAYGIELSMGQMAIVVVTITLASIGAAGVPGAAIVVMSLVLASVGLPIEIVALIAAVDRLIDMGCTSANVTGDTVTAVVVAHTEGTLDVDQYNRA